MGSFNVRFKSYLDKHKGESPKETVTNVVKDSIFNAKSAFKLGKQAKDKKKQQEQWNANDNAPLRGTVVNTSSTGNAFNDITYGGGAVADKTSAVNLGEGQVDTVSRSKRRKAFSSSVNF